MNYLKGWKTKMETNKTYGRKVIREDRTEQKKKARRFIALYIICLLVIGGCIGSFVSYAVMSRTDDNEQVLNHIRTYGAYDGKTFTSEPDIELEGEEFTPLDCKLNRQTQEFTFYLCKTYDIDWTLVMAIMQHESDFEADAVSKTDDFGLMQINRSNADWLEETLGVDNLLDAEQNIRAGTFIVRKLFEEYTDTNLVLMSYNMGEKGAESLWNKGIYSTPYVDKVLKIQKKFNEQLEKGEN